MVRATQNTLLALLLGLKDLDIPLSLAERAELDKAGEQLKLDPKDWQFIENGLTNVIEGNSFLKQQFQAAKAKLDAIEGEFPIHLLPTEAELQEELPMDFPPEKRGFRPGETSPADSQAIIINDVVVPVLRDNDPPKRAKKLNCLARLQKHIQEKSS